MNPAPDDTISAALSAWAIEHAPEHLRYAARRGHVITSAVLDTITQMLGAALGGRPLRPLEELIKWRPRTNLPRPESIDAYKVTSRALEQWCEHHALPAVVEFRAGPIVRVEEQPDVRNPAGVLKYSGVIITITCSDCQKRYVLVNLETVMLT